MNYAAKSHVPEGYDPDDFSFVDKLGPASATTPPCPSAAELAFEGFVSNAGTADKNTAALALQKAFEQAAALSMVAEDEE